MLEEKINEAVRDFTSIVPRPKSEVRRRILELIAIGKSDRDKELMEKIEKHSKIYPSDNDDFNAGFSAAHKDILDLIK